ncbi:PASTA domain-containing protein [bacterium]|nr:PASTA domain-containing protein [bacterium]
MHTGSYVTRQKFMLVLVIIMWMRLIAKLVVLQIVNHEGYDLRAYEQRFKPFDIEAQRGRIMDRNGIVMASSSPSASYGIMPSMVKNRVDVVCAVANATGKSIDSVNSMFDNDKFQWIVRLAEPSVIDKLDKVKSPGLQKQFDFKRYYPLGRVGSQVIGVTDVDGFGIEGCELFFNDDLLGRNGRSTLLRDARGRTEQSLDKPIVKALRGLDVILTIDSKIQDIAEEELETCVSQYKAKWGGAIVLDAGTGEILVMANVPRYDPNDSGTYASKPEFMRNRLVTDMVEPGSTFKIVTFSEALESGIISEDDMINCENGKYKIAGHIINDTHELSVVPAGDVFIHSSNIGTVKIADMIGKKMLYERARLFGFGEITGIDYPYETPGRLENPRQWSKLSLPTISFGQGVAVSPLQIVMAYGAIANNGALMMPHIVKEVIGTPERPGRTFSSQKVRDVISPQTAARMTELLVGVVERGTGKNAAIPHVRVGGKTGTAQCIREGAKGYVPGQYMSSFVGFVADRDPKIVCLVMIDSPEGVYYGSQVAAPVFRNIVNRMLNLADTPWNDLIAENALEDTVITVRLPDVKGKRISEAVESIRNLGLNPEVYGDSTVVDKQSPLPGAQLNPGTVVKLYSNTLMTVQAGLIKVPDLIGKSLREATQDLIHANLDVTVSGSGVVKEQNPRAGTYVRNGTVCMLACSKR